jgi:hypothetical protein
MVAAAKAEAQWLLDVGFIREVLYPCWLANVVMVKKKNVKWRMCTDFTDLNKCCSKDDFPLSRIDKVVDSAIGCETMAVLDCFSKYHQIWLRKEDEQKTSFIMPFGTYCYFRMPEGLKNAGPMFCRMTKVILKDQMQRNVFAYIDNIMVASRKKSTQIQDLAETFTNMHRAQLKLNPEKCVCGMPRGKVLGCLVLVKGIKANPDKINAVVHMKPPQSRKELQRLTGRIAALNRFMVKLAERSLPFFKVLRGSDSFEWGSEQQEAFDALNDHMQKMPTLASPQLDQPLIMSVSATHTTVSRALVQEREISKEGRKLYHQVPIHFVSKALAGSKKHYSEIEKIYYAVVMSTRKLRHYFEANKVKVQKNQPLNDTFRNQVCSGRIRKWAMELSEHIVDFEKRSAIKSQVLADFIVDWTEPSCYTEVTMIDTPWQGHCDGAWRVSRAGAAAILMSPLGIKLRYVARL